MWVRVPPFLPTSMPVKNKEKQAEWAKAHYNRNKPAMKARSIAFRKEQRKLLGYIVDGYKANMPCTDCDKLYPPYVIDFDHRYDKLDSVSVLVSKGVAIERLMAEIDKCDLVCANCHRERTFKKQGLVSRHMDR